MKRKHDLSVVAEVDRPAFISDLFNLYFIKKSFVFSVFFILIFYFSYVADLFFGILFIDKYFFVLVCFGVPVVLGVVYFVLSYFFYKRWYKYIN